MYVPMYTIQCKIRATPGSPCIVCQLGIVANQVYKM